MGGLLNGMVPALEMGRGLADISRGKGPTEPPCLGWGISIEISANHLEERVRSESWKSENGTKFLGGSEMSSQ